MRLPSWLRFRPIHLWAVIWVGIAVIVLYQLRFFGSADGDGIESTSIRPEADGTVMSSGGEFTGVFSNHAEGPVTVRRIVLIDEGNKSLACGTNQTIDIPDGGVFKAQIVGCGARRSGDEFEVNIRIDYDKNVTGRIESATEIGILGGIIG